MTPGPHPLRRLLVGLALLAAGCGYSTGIRMPEGIETVGIEVFGNDSKQRDLELEFQEVLVESTSRMVHAPIVPPGEADLVLRGRIVDYRRRGGIRSPENELLESGVRIVIDAQLVRRFPQSVIVPGPEPDRSGLPPSTRDDRNTLPDTAPNERVLRPLRVAQDYGFIVDEPQGEARARRRSLRYIADRMVLELFGTLAHERAP